MNTLVRALVEDTATSSESDLNTMTSIPVTQLQRWWLSYFLFPLLLSTQGWLNWGITIQRFRLGIYLLFQARLRTNSPMTLDQAFQRANSPPNSDATIPQRWRHPIELIFYWRSSGTWVINPRLSPAAVNAKPEARISPTIETKYSLCRTLWLSNISFLYCYVCSSLGESINNGPSSFKFASQPNVDLSSEFGPWPRSGKDSSGLGQQTCSQWRRITNTYR